MLMSRTIGGLVMAVSVLLGVAGCKDKPAAAPVNTVKPIAMLSVDGVGPLNAETPFNLHLITDAFQGLNVAQQTNFTEGSQYPVIKVSKELKPLLTINPDAKHEKVFSIMVQDNLIGNQLGHAIGTAFSSIYPYGQPVECAAGSEELSGKVLCYAPKTGNILYQFGGEWNGPAGSVPPKEVLANWKIEAMIWKPPAK
jgi:hypothetical protein